MFEFLAKDLLADLAKRQGERPPETCIIPDVMMPTGITDNDGYAVFRIVAMRKFSDDVIKAFRRAGIVARTFDYNIQKW